MRMFQGVPDPIRVSDGDGPIVYTALVIVVVALAGAIAVLWRVSEKRIARALKAAEDREDRAKADGERALKAAEEREEKSKAEAKAQVDREVARTEQLAQRIATERGEFVKEIQAQRVAFTQALDTQRETDHAIIDRQRQEFEATIRAVVERQAAADLARDTKLTELVSALGRVVEALQHRSPRRQ